MRKTHKAPCVQPDPYRKGDCCLCMLVTPPLYVDPHGCEDDADRSLCACPMPSYSWCFPSILAFPAADPRVVTWKGKGPRWAQLHQRSLSGS